MSAMANSELGLVHLPPAERCNTCQTAFGRVSNAQGKAVALHAGDIAVCATCGTPHIFDQDIHLRLATFAELHVMPVPAKQVLRTLQDSVRALENVRRVGAGCVVVR